MHLLDVGAARGAELTAEGRVLDERAQRVDERLLRRGHDRDADAVALGARLDDVRLEVRDDRLAERHRLEREDAVPAGVQLVDDDVGARVALARLGVRDALDDLELDRELRAGLDHVRRALLLAVRGRVDDERPRRVRRRASACTRLRSRPGGTTCASGTQRIAS